MKRAVLVGLGMVAETHLAALRDARNVKLAGVMARDPAKASAFADRAARSGHPSLRVYTSAEEIAQDTSIDLVILATPPDARLQYVEILSDAGKPILMEKPIERSLAAARHIVELCERRGTPLGLVFQHRFREASVALKQVLNRGGLGQIATAEVRVPWWRDQAYYDVEGRGTRARDGGGVMITQAIHTLDLLLWLIGPIARVMSCIWSSRLHRLECEDWASSSFETTGGSIGSFTATTTAFPGSAESIALHGSDGSAILEAGVLKLMYRDGRVETVGETSATGGGADPMAFTHAWHQAVLEGFVDSLDGVSKQVATGREALMSHAVIDAMERSSVSGLWQEVEHA